MKNTFLICLLSIVPALIYTADDSELKIKEQELATKKFEEIYGNVMQKAEDDRCEKMTEKNANLCLSHDITINGLSRHITFCTILDNDGKTTRGKSIDRDQDEYKIDITIEDQHLSISKKRKNAPREETFYKKIDLFELRENRYYPFLRENSGYSFKEKTQKKIFNNIAKITSCMFMALKSKNTISFSEDGPYEIVLTHHNLPKDCIKDDPFYEDSKNKSLLRYDLFLGYLNSIGEHLTTSPHAYVTFNATLPTTLQELTLFGTLSDYTLDNAPQNLKLVVTGRHSTFDTNKQPLNKEIELSGNGNEILYDPSKSNVKIDPKCQAFTLSPQS